MHSTDQSQQDAFQQRIARISKDRGVTEVAAVKQNYLSTLAYPLSFIGAAVIGALSVFLARYVRYHMGAGSLAGEGADTMMIMDVVMASMVGLFLKMIFRIQAQHYKSAQTVGVFAMVALMHNAVHAAPGVFTAVFSQEWVEQVVEMTDPKTLLFAGVSVPIGGEAHSPAKNSEPQHIQMQNGG